MRLHNFFIKEKINGRENILVADSSLIKQWIGVLRFQTGSQVILLDNSGKEHLAIFVSLAWDGAKLKILETKESKNIPEKEIYLCQSLIKKDKMEWVFEKGTELGVSFFLPILSERSEKKKINKERAEKIITEASEQSGRGVKPYLHELKTLEEILEDFPIPSICFDPSGKDFSVYKDNFLSKKEVGIFIGPEGGWSERELRIFKEKNIPIFSLGRQILRAETAAIAVSAIMLLD